jgi:hypothetical protein
MPEFKHLQYFHKKNKEERYSKNGQARCIYPFKVHAIGPTSEKANHELSDVCSDSGGGRPLQLRTYHAIDFAQESIFARLIFYFKRNHTPMSKQLAHARRMEINIHLVQIVVEEVSGNDTRKNGGHIGWAMKLTT